MSKSPRKKKVRAPVPGLPPGILAPDALLAQLRVEIPFAMTPFPVSPQRRAEMLGLIETVLSATREPHRHRWIPVYRAGDRDGLPIRVPIRECRDCKERQPINATESQLRRQDVALAAEIRARETDLQRALTEATAVDADATGLQSVTVISEGGGAPIDAPGLEHALIDALSPREREVAW